MTSKQRFQAVMNRQLPDRLPADMLWPRSETLRDLRNHFKTDSDETVLRKLGVDFRWVGCGEKYPEFEKKCNREMVGDTPGAGKRYIFHDDRTFEDEWGIVHRIGSDGKYLEWRGGPLVDKESIGDWQPPQMVLPSADAIRASWASIKEYVLIGVVTMPFKIAWHVASYEYFLAQMALDPEFVETIYERIYAFETAKAVRMAEAGADVIAIVGDIAGSNGPMFSVNMFERFDLLRFQKMVDTIRAANPTVKILYHSDGLLEPFIPALIKCGIDILNPIESNCMDPADIKRKFGEQLAFHGAISVQKTIPNGTVADVKNEVNERIRTVGYNGGYIVSNENSFPYNAPLENVLAIYEAVQAFDYASLRNG